MRAIVLALIALFCLIIISGCDKKEEAAPVTTASTSGGATETGAPHLKSNVLMYYEKSAEAWLRDAVQETNAASGNDGRLTADFRGSREGKQALLYGSAEGTKFTAGSKTAPVIWNPADTYWAYKLNQDVKNPKLPNRSDAEVGQPDVILNSRLVLVFWKDRADVFNKLAAEAKYMGKTWLLLHDLAADGWKIGGKPEWGTLKLAQSDPVRSNSGMLALRLMFGEWQSGHANAKPSDAPFVAWMTQIEKSVKGGFAETTSTAFDAMLKGGVEQYDGAIVYEQNVLAKVDAGENRLTMVYPAPTAAVNFPALVVKASWVAAQQTADAKAFVAYLQSPKVQDRAVAKGFRPASASASLSSLETVPHKEAGFRADAVVDEKPIAPDVIDGLLFLWNKTFGKSA